MSEIGEMGSPARFPFTIMLCCVALCLLVFAAGVGIFAFPHPLHNIFGESELIGYQAPVAFALTWRAGGAGCTNGGMHAVNNAGNRRS